MYLSEEYHNHLTDVFDQELKEIREKLDSLDTDLIFNEGPGTPTGNRDIVLGVHAIITGMIELERRTQALIGTILPIIDETYEILDVCHKENKIPDDAPSIPDLVVSFSDLVGTYSAAFAYLDIIQRNLVRCHAFISRLIRPDLAPTILARAQAYTLTKQAENFFEKLDPLYSQATALLPRLRTSRPTDAALLELKHLLQTLEHRERATIWLMETLTGLKHLGEYDYIFHHDLDGFESTDQEHIVVHAVQKGTSPRVEPVVRFLKLLSASDVLKLTGEHIDPIINVLASVYGGPITKAIDAEYSRRYMIKGLLWRNLRRPVRRELRRRLTASSFALIDVDARIIEAFDLGRFLGLD